ncbi:MAG: hypothetical protein HYS40_05515 [Gemmatimonadetes bacterium]|nr:hypothetical protein [Gemmatimonadota bacterium]
MTLGRLVLAWVPVAFWFLIAGYVGRRLAGAAFPVERRSRRWADIWTLAEAGVVTLFASLWFDSLGRGGWWLLFLLVGLLAAFPVRLQALLATQLPGRAELILGAVDVVRYVGAGAILAWRLR